MLTISAKSNRLLLVSVALGLGVGLAACGSAPAATATLTLLPATTPNAPASGTPLPSATVRPTEAPAASATATPANRATLEATYSPRATATASAGAGTARIPSPDGNYYIEVSALGAALYRTGDTQPLSQVAGPYDPEYAGAFWSPDSQLAITTADNILVTLWRTDGTPPLALDLGEADHFWFVWSPDSAYVAMAEDDYSQEYMAFVIVQPDGGMTRMNGGGVREGQNILSIRWLTPSVFEVAASDGMCCGRFVYFDVGRGGELWHWIDSFEQSQSPAYSPDSVWQVTDSSFRVWEGEPYASGQHYEHVYELHQWATVASYTIYGGAEQYVEWVGWTPDSATFYLISRPANAEAIAAVNLPFGLLALDPATREARVVFEQAVFAALNVDQTAACVVFPARRADGRLGLDVGVFDLTAGTLAGRQGFADEISYPVPASVGGGPYEWAAGALAACGW